MGIGSELRKFGRKFEDTSRRGAKYTLAAGGAMMGGASGAKAGYQIGSAFDDRKPQARQTGTDLGKLRSEATANGFNPLTVLRATGGQGFARDQVPIGRLSSDAFFNAFDAYQSYQNKNTSLIEDPKIEIKYDNLTEYKQGGVKIPELRKLNSEPILSPLTYEVVNIDGNHTSSTVKSLWHQYMMPDGEIIELPAEELEWGNLFLGAFVHAAHGRRKNWRIIAKDFKTWWNKNPKKHNDIMQKAKQFAQHKDGQISTKTLGRMKTKEELEFFKYLKTQTSALQ